MTGRLRILAVPGTFCSPEVFAPLRRELGDQVALASVDWMNGPGPWDLASVAGRVASLAQELDPAVVLGHSTGGAVCLRLALDRPDLVERLVLVSTGAAMEGHGDVDRIIERLEGGEGEAVATDVVVRSFGSPPPEPVLSRLLAYAASAPTPAAIDILRSQREMDFRPLLGGIRCPALLVHGEHDPVRTLAHAEELADGLGDATLRVVAAGHSPMFESPGVVAEALRTWQAVCGRGGGP